MTPLIRNRTGTFSAECFFNGPAKNINRPTVQQDVQQPGMHELIREQLPDEAMFQALPRLTQSNL